MKTKILLLVVIYFALISCKRIEKECTCCPYHKVEKVSPFSKEKYRKIFCNLVENSSGEQLLKSMELPVIKFKSNEELRKLKNELISGVK